MKCVGIVLCIGLHFCSSALADNWPQWRGPTQNGVAPGQGYPTSWSPTENVRWKVALPGRGASTPVVWEDHIFLTSGVGGKNTVLCFDRQGKTRWTKTLGSEIEGENKKASGANPSCTTDGQHVYGYFKSGQFVCLDFDGQVVWETKIGYDVQDGLWWDLGNSPVLTKDNVVLPLMVTGPSYLIAFDKATGKVAWKQDRNVPAPDEAAQSYTTPIVYRDVNGKEVIVVAGADHVTAHDAESGQELWRVGEMNPAQNKYNRSISSPVLSGDVVLVPYSRGNTVTAIRTGGQGDVTKSQVLWIQENLGADVPTPVAADGKLYVCSDKGEVVCLGVGSQKELWRTKVESNRNVYSSSPILANGYLYITREDGTTFVIDAGGKHEVIAKNSLDETTVATPVFVDGTILIRTYDSLYCIGK